MPSNLYRKAVASAAFAVSMLLTSLVSGALASQDNRVHGLTGHDLLKGQVSTASPHTVENQGITAAQLGLTPSAPSPAFSRTVYASAIGPVPSTPVPVLGTDVIATTFSKSAVTKLPSVAHAMVAQRSSEIAQDNVAVDDSFAPLSDAELRQLLLNNPNFVAQRPRLASASSALAPSVYDSDWGDAFVGSSGVTSRRNEPKWDDLARLGIGADDAVEHVSVEVSSGVMSFDGSAKDGMIDFKLHETFPKADDLAIALGWSNSIDWRKAELAKDIFADVATKSLDVRSGNSNYFPLTASLGFGFSGFRSNGVIASGSNAPNVFDGLGLRFIPELSVLYGWTGGPLGLGVSSVPFDFPRLMTTLDVADLTGNTSALNFLH